MDPHETSWCPTYNDIFTASATNDERRIVLKKIDRRLLPVLGGIYMLQCEQKHASTLRTLLIVAYKISTSLLCVGSLSALKMLCLTTVDCSVCRRLQFPQRYRPKRWRILVAWNRLLYRVYGLRISRRLSHAEMPDNFISWDTHHRVGRSAVRYIHKTRHSSLL